MKTIFFDNKPNIISTYSVVGPKESQSPLKKCFDLELNNDNFNEATYEKAERKMIYTAVKNLIKKCNLKESDVELLILGDLLNQNIQMVI